MGKTIFVKTYGCQMNAYDSERMVSVMAGMGYTPSETMEGSHLVVLNTCHIREKATDKIYSELGLLNLQKQQQAAEGQPMLIAVAGCVGQAEGEEITRRAPYVDIVLGPQSYHRLPEMVTKALRREGHVIDLAFDTQEKFDSLPEQDAPQGATAYLSVQEGCDKFCSFCVVPYTRGAEFSRPVSAIIREAILLAGKGVKEITLLGQNVNAYHGEGPKGNPSDLGTLIRLLARVEGIERIRYTTSHPRDMHDSLYEVHGSEPKLMPFLHLPVQSGSDRVLKAMNRKHTAADYLRIIERLRVARPDMAFSSDFIVGFPGETEHDFEETLALIREVRLAQAYSFAYSPRPGTPAASAPDQIPEELASERLHRLQALIAEQQHAFNASMVGRVLDVLLEKPGRHAGQLIGRSPYMQSVHLEADSATIGSIVPVTILETRPNSLAGKLTIPPVEYAA
jgi:tRNA-2-methylthio-N6-dimethylallyladenosine synthase